MTDISIKVENAGKKFSKSLKRMMFYGMLDIAKNIAGMQSGTGHLREGEFWAVEGVSFDLKQGETLGVIGPNGSGKTTLLKMLNGIFMPDEGRIRVNGRVGALIQVGAGFHPMLTGRENIYVNGAVLGMSKKEIDRKFDSIVDFAEIGDFLDAPVKHYSSGMYVRLGFSVAIHCDPGILLVDEILAVGDKDFTMKCFKKMHEIREAGVTIVLVSHNEVAIRERTEKCLYLQNGRCCFYGPSEEGVSMYIKDVLEHKEKKRAEKGLDRRVGKEEAKAEITGLRFFDKEFKEISFIESGKEINLVIEYVTRSEFDDLIFGVNFYGDTGFKYCANSSYENVAFRNVPLGHGRVKINIPGFHLPTDNYLCSVVIAEKDPGNLVDWNDMAYSLTVGRAKNSRGAIKLPTKWEWEKNEETGSNSE
ncbi:MAG: ABC transporter ATP-binding protein [Candidatus Omnitrophota bacterium]